MRIFNTDNIELVEPDMTKGRLVEDKRFVAHHEAIEGVPDQFHYEVIKEYPHGGREVKKVIDVPGVQAVEAWDEYEDILRFVPFTEFELATNRVEELKQKLQDTDFHILKIVEGAKTLADCAEIIAKRASWRKEINELENTVLNSK